MMKGHEPETMAGMTPDLKEVLERLIAPDAHLRSGAVDELAEVKGVEDDPLFIYLLATRLLDPDLEIRFQVVKVLGRMLEFEHNQHTLQGRSLEILVSYLADFEKDQYVKLLEVSEAYLAAEESLTAILKVCSYAGNSLGGIVNDRKLPVRIRQQAIFFCGEIGFMGTADALRNLISRVEKDRIRSGFEAARKNKKDQEALYTYALSALGKLGV
ncbi:MAG: hypothetical protein ACK2TT_07310 [Anaerolineales bacterium]